MNPLLFVQRILVFALTNPLVFVQRILDFALFALFLPFVKPAHSYLFEPLFWNILVLNFLTLIDIWIRFSIHCSLCIMLVNETNKLYRQMDCV